MSVNLGMNTNSLVSTKPINFPTNPWIIASDDPRNGGITGNIGKHDKPQPGVFEERPTMIDSKTGEIVYVDQYNKDNPWICTMA